MKEMEKRKHEIHRLSYVFLGATSVGIGIYLSAWFALRPLYYKSLAFSLRGVEWLLFPLFFGIGGVLLSLGKKEVK